MATPSFMRPGPTGLGAPLPARPRRARLAPARRGTLQLPARIGGHPDDVLAHAHLARRRRSAGSPGGLGRLRLRHGPAGPLRSVAGGARRGATRREDPLVPHAAAARGARRRSRRRALSLAQLALLGVRPPAARPGTLLLHPDELRRSARLLPSLRR